jgi:pimeloyl-ACP methyl ester carboxylesterase
LDHTFYKGPDALTLADVAQVICYDHRGNGRSDWGSPDDWTLGGPSGLADLAG